MATIKEIRRKIQTAGLAVATKQALRFEHGCTFSKISALTGVYQKNVSSHVAAKRGSNVRAWHNRPPEQKAAAIALAADLLTAQ